MKKLLLTLSIGLLMITHADAKKPPTGLPSLTDKFPPKLILEMNDTKNAGPIIWYEHNVMPPKTHWKYNYVGPSALGCKGNFSKAAAEWWDSRFYHDFLDSYVINRTYFFRDLAGNNAPIGEVPYSFTVRAQDLSGIKRIYVSTPEREVETVPWYQGYQMVDDGPTEFINVTPNAATADMSELRDDDGNLTGWIKSLNYQVPPVHPDDRSKEVRLDFSMTHLGQSGELTVLVEDNAGNTQTGSVYLAPDWICPE